MAQEARDVGEVPRAAREGFQPSEAAQPSGSVLNVVKQQTHVVLFRFFKKGGRQQTGGDCVPFIECGVNGVFASLHLIEGLQPLTKQFDLKPAGHRVDGRDTQVLRTVTDAGAQRFGDGLLGTPEAQDCDRGFTRVGGQFQFLVREDAAGKIFAEDPAEDFDVDTDAGIGGDCGNDQL